MTDLASLLSADLLEALDALVAERVAEAVAEAMQEVRPTWLSVEEAAEHARLSRKTIERLVDRGDLRPTRIGRRPIINRAALDSYLESRARA